MQDNAFKTESSRAGTDLKLEWISTVDGSTNESTKTSSNGDVSQSQPPTSKNPTAMPSTSAPSSFAEFEAMVLANLSKAAAAQQNKVS